MRLKNEPVIPNGSLLAPKLTPEIFRAARAELVWLKSVKGKPTWQKVFADFLLYRILIKFRAGANFTGEGQKYTSGKINPL